jgi:hypothetical protein
MASNRVWIAVLAAALGVGCYRPPGVNLLVGRAFNPSEAMPRAVTITDGALASFGEVWNSGSAAILPSAATSLITDLGAPQTIGAAFLQADANDHYTLSGSLDGVNFDQLWDAPPVPGGGLQIRRTDRLKATARFLRLTASGGDGYYSVSELQVFTSAPAAWPEAPGTPPPPDLISPFAWPIFLFGAACALFLLIGCQGSTARGALVALLPLASAIWLLAEVVVPRTFVDRDVSWLRAIVAAIALLAVARPFIRLGQGPLDDRRINGMLALLAVVAVGCFFNLGRAQFWDAKEGRLIYVHNNDMRVYYPAAKYFHELQYDGLYLASVAAYIDNTGQSPESLANTQLRDLRTHRMWRVRNVMGAINAVRGRFTPERWQEFREDMRYFHETMGPAYLSTLTDHGASASPVWLTIAYLIFAWTHASTGTLWVAALLDPLLLLLCAVMIARAFGARTALVCLVVYGVTDYYMFGTNWAGSTLRNDWMVAIGLGVVALKRERWKLGGALLAYAGLVRAFPMVAVLALAMPPLWWVVDERRSAGRWPSLDAFVRAHRGALHALAGAALCAVGLVVLSSVILSPSAWILWLQKAIALSQGHHVNHVSLRNLAAMDLGTWQTNRGWLRSAARTAFLIVSTIAFIGLALRAFAGRKPEQAAVISLLLIPVLFYPANYYLHCVFLLPLLATTDGARTRDAIIWSLLLAMCAAEYVAAAAETVPGHFAAESIVMSLTFFTLATLLAVEKREAGAGESRFEVAVPTDDDARGGARRGRRRARRQRGAGGRLKRAH